MVVGGDDLAAVDLATGETRWSYFQGFSDSASVANGMAYAVRNGAVVQIDLELGDIVRTFATGRSITSKPVVTDDVLVVASATRTYLYQLWDGAEVAQIPEGGELAVGDGLVVIVSGTRVAAYDLL
jgi:outer membrane protein assembly factor BamB